MSVAQIYACENELPDGVKVVAAEDAVWNRTTYYHPLLRDKTIAPVPDTAVFEINTSPNGVMSVDTEAIQQFIRERGIDEWVLKTDYACPIQREENVRCSTDSMQAVKDQFSVLIESVIRHEKPVGENVIASDYIPNQTEIWYYIDSGDIIDSTEFGKHANDRPRGIVESITDVFSELPWRVDLIKSNVTGEWYCIDMVLDGYYYDSGEWVPMATKPWRDESEIHRVQNELATPDVYNIELG